MQEAATHCRPGVRQEKGTIEFRFGSGSVPCVVVLVDNHTLHRSQPSFQRRGFATAKCDGPEAYPCTCRCHCLMMLFEVVKKQSPNAVAKFPKVKLWGEPNTSAPGVHFSYLFFQCTPCWWPGSVNRDIFAKVPRKLCERAGESQSACWRGWASKPCQNYFTSRKFRESNIFIREKWPIPDKGILIKTHI